MDWTLVRLILGRPSNCGKWLRFVDTWASWPLGTAGADPGFSGGGGGGGGEFRQMASHVI